MTLEKNELEALSSASNISLTLHTGKDLQRALDILSSAAISGLKVKGCSIKVLDEKQTNLEIASMKGMSKQFVKDCGPSGMFNSCVNQEALQGESIFISNTDAEKELEIPEEVTQEGIHAIASLPIKIENRVVGVISVYHDKTHEFDESDRVFLDSLAVHCASVINNYRQNERTQTLLEIAKEVNSSLNIDKVLKDVVEQTAHSMKVKAASIRLLDEATNKLVFKTAYGLSKEYLSIIPSSIEESPIDRMVLDTRETVYVEDVMTDPRVIMPEKTKEEGLGSMLCAALHIQNKSIGVLKVYTAKPAPFTSDEVHFMESVAELAAVAIANASLYEKIHGLYNMTLEMATTYEASKLLDLLTRKAATYVHALGSQVLIWDEDKEEFLTRSTYHLADEFVNSLQLDKECWSTKETMEGKTLIIDNIEKEEKLDIRDAALKAGIYSMVSIPLKVKERVTGILQVYCQAPRAFSDDEVEFLTTLTNHSAIAIDNAVIHEKLRADYEKLIDDIYIWHDWTTYVLRE